MRLSAFFLVVLLALTSSACAHRPAAKARTLMSVGALGIAGGLLVTGGCTEPSETGGCGSPGGGSLGAGIPLIAAGAAMLGIGIAIKPSSAARLKYTDPLPPPSMPDPFVQPLVEP